MTLSSPTDRSRLRLFGLSTDRRCASIGLNGCWCFIGSRWRLVTLSQLAASRFTSGRKVQQREIRLKNAELSGNTANSSSLGHYTTVRGFCIISFYIIIFYIILFYNILNYFTLYYLILHYVTLYYMIVFNIKYHIISYYIIFYNVT